MINETMGMRAVEYIALRSVSDNASSRDEVIHRWRKSGCRSNIDDILDQLIKDRLVMRLHSESGPIYCRTMNGDLTKRMADRILQPSQKK